MWGQLFAYMRKLFLILKQRQLDKSPNREKWQMTFFFRKNRENLYDTRKRGFPNKIKP